MSQTLQKLVLWLIRIIFQRKDWLKGFSKYYITGTYSLVYFYFLQISVEFGRLTVAIAEKLTLDHCLKLARICKLRMSDCHTVRRLSFMDSPGMKFLYVLTKRGVINMFDVTNIQKALAMLHLETVNRELVVPYQDKIDKEQYVQYKAEELYTWEGKLSKQ